MTASAYEIPPFWQDFWREAQESLNSNTFVGVLMGLPISEGGRSRHFVVRNVAKIGLVRVFFRIAT